MKTAGILLFCTGKYIKFLDNYVTSCEKNFLPDVKKKYFIFTDSEVNFPETVNYQYIFQAKLGWPYDTLKRYEIVYDKKELFEGMDFLLMTNANFVYNEVVMSDEIFPNEQDNWFASIDHPNWYDKDNYRDFPYEGRQESVAYVAPEERRKYLQACLVIGRTPEFLDLAKFVKEESAKDLARGIMGMYWDESYVNKYWITKQPKVLPPNYSYPETYNIPGPKKIIMLEKGLHGGHDFLRSA